MSPIRGRVTQVKIMYNQKKILTSRLNQRTSALFAKHYQISLAEPFKSCQFLQQVSDSSFGMSSVCQVNSSLSAGHGLLVELLITFELVFTVFATCDPRRTDLGGSAGLAIGFAVAIGHLFAVSASLPHLTAPF